MIPPVLRDRIVRVLPAVAYLAAAAAFVKNRFSLLDFPLDDAWIHQVYARSLALGCGFAYNSGQPEAGSTSPLWSLLTAPAQWQASTPICRRSASRRSASCSDWSAC